jgi:hypothetical protein
LIIKHLHRARPGKRKNSGRHARQRKKAAGTPGGLVRLGRAKPTGKRFNPSTEGYGSAIHSRLADPLESTSGGSWKSVLGNHWYLTESASQPGFHAGIQGVDFLESAKVQAIEGHNLTDLATYVASDKPGVLRHLAPESVLLDQFPPNIGQIRWIYQTRKHLLKLLKT